MRTFLFAISVATLNGPASSQDVQLQPQFYMQALQQQGASCSDENVKLKGGVMQYAAEVADLKKRLAEAEAKVAPYPIDPNISD